MVDIEERIKGTNLETKLKRLLQDAEKGVMSLLSGFYFQQVAYTGNDSKTFEFTHKSFSEYLIATYLFQKIYNICTKVDEYCKGNSDDGYQNDEALKKWIILFGRKPLGDGFVKFINNELRIIPVEKLKIIQNALAELINYELKNGLPVEISKDCTSYSDMKVLALNSEFSLFIILGVVAGLRAEMSAIEWESNYGFHNLNMRIGEINENNIFPFMQNLNYLTIQDQFMNFQYLLEANLQEANLKKAQILRSQLKVLDLSEKQLSEIIIVEDENFNRRHKTSNSSS